MDGGASERVAELGVLAAGPRWRGGYWHRIGVVIAGLILATAVVINQSAVHWRGNLADDHLFAYHGWCVSQGARPYLDIWDNKPPGIWWLNAAAFCVCGEGIGADVLLGSFAVLTALLAFVGIAQTVYHRSLLVPAALLGAVLLTDIRFECGGNRTETYVVVCESLAMLGYLRWLRRRRTAWLIVAGLAAGAAPLFKQAGLAVTAAGALHLAFVQWQARRGAPTTKRSIRGWRPWLLAGSGMAVAPLAAAIALASDRALGAAYFAVGTFNRAYFAIDDATWIHIGRALAFYQPVLRILLPLFVLAGVGLLWGLSAWGLARRKTGSGASGRRGVGVLWLWFVLAVYLACVGPGRCGYHFMPALPALGLLALYPLHLLAGRRGLPSQLAARPGITLAMAVWVYVVATLASGGLHEVSQAWRSKPHWYAAARTVADDDEAQGKAVRRLTSPSERIYVWGWSPGTYRYAYRQPVSRFTTLEKCGQLGEHARFIMTGALADIRHDPPAVLVISVNDYPGLFAPSMDGLGDWVAARYERVDTIQGMHILTRRP